MLVHGVLEVALSMSLTSLQFSEAVFSRFGIDFADFADDYDALFNSTLCANRYYSLVLRPKKKDRCGKK